MTRSADGNPPLTDRMSKAKKQIRGYIYLKSEFRDCEREEGREAAYRKTLALQAEHLQLPLANKEALKEACRVRRKQVDEEEAAAKASRD